MKGHGSDHPHRRSVRLKGYDYTVTGAYFVTVVTHERRCLFGDVIDGVLRRNAVGEVVAACWAAIPRHYEHVVLDEWVVMPNHVHGVLVFRPIVATTGGTAASGGTVTSGRRGEASAAMPPRLSQQPSAADASPSPNTTYPHDPTPDVLRPIGTRAGSVGAVIQNFKSVAGRRIRVVWKGEASAVDGCSDRRLGIAADASPLRGVRAGGARGAGGAGGPRRPNPSPVWQRNYHEHIVRDLDDLDRIRRYIRENPLRWTLDGTRRR